MIAVSNNSEPPPKIKTLFSPQVPLQKNCSNPNYPTTKMLKCIYPPPANTREGKETTVRLSILLLRICVWTI